MNFRTVVFQAALAATLAFGAVALAHAADTHKPVKVFILAGQSNMEGKAKVSLLEYQANAEKTRAEFAHLKKDGKWIVRDDVWIKFLDRKGNLTVGFGSPGCIGPELEFGLAVGDHFDEQVLLIKTAWGGKSLCRDFRPPSSGLPPDDVLQGMVDRAKKPKGKNAPEVTLDTVKASYGAFYRQMLSEVDDTLKNLKRDFPDYQGQGFEIAGIAWFQGWNDMIDPVANAEYEKNMVNFIRDVRKDLKRPNLPFVIGQVGFDGAAGDKNPKLKMIKAAQAAAGEVPEFRGNVKVVKTDVFWDSDAEAVFKKGWREHQAEWNTVGSDFGYHYYGSARTYSKIGRALGEAMIELQEKK
jgi:alpha-galactosidase